MSMSNHKTLGIIGGMGAYAGSWLLQRVIELTPANNDQDHLEIMFHSNSAIPDRTAAILGGETSPVPELLRSVEILNVAGAQVLTLACMSAHYYRVQIRSAFKGNFIDAVELSIKKLVAEASDKNLQKVGIIGSTGLIKSNIFQNEFEANGLEAVVLNARNQEKYFMEPLYRKGGIKSNGISERPVNEFRKQVDILQEQGAEIILGACSEVPLLLDMKQLQIPFIDAFNVLAGEIVKSCYLQKQLTNEV